MSKRAKTFRFRGEWIGKSAGGCLNNYTWRFNPQIFLTVTERITVSINLLQDGSELEFIGFYVAKSDGTSRRQLTLSREQLINKVGFEESKSVDMNVELEPNVQYVVIPCTFTPGAELKFVTTFSASLSADAKLILEPLTPNREWKQLSLESEWKGPSAGGCKNFASCVDNPQFMLTVSKKTNVHILLVSTPKDSAEFDEVIGFYVLKTGAVPTGKMLKLASEDVVGKADFQSPKEADWQGPLTPDRTYVIVPCTFDPKHESRFKLIVLSDHVVKVRTLQDKPEGFVVEGEWTRETSGGCVNHPTWRNNPQFVLTMAHDADLPVTLTLRQLNDEDQTSIGFYVSRAADDRKQFILSPDDLLGKGAFERSKSVSAEVTLHASQRHYIITPCTFHPEQVSQFVLSVAPHAKVSPSKLNLRACADTHVLHRAAGQWKGANAGGCRNFKTWLRNPQFYVSVAKDADVTLVLAQESADVSIGFYVVAVGPVGAAPAVVESAKKEAVLKKTQFRKDTEVALRCTLPPGTYNVVVCMFEAAKEGAYHFLVYSNPPVVVRALDEHATVVEPPAGDANGSLAASAADAAPLPSSASDAAALVEESAAGGASPVLGRARSSSSEDEGGHGKKERKKEKKMKSSRKKNPNSGNGSHSMPSSPAQVRGAPVPTLPDERKSGSQLAQQLRGMEGGAPNHTFPWEIDFDEIQIEEKIGQGGFGVVYRGMWRGTQVAIKKLLSDDFSTQEFDEFVREIEIMSKLRHPQIVLFLGACIRKPNICILTEFLEKGNLAKVLKDELSLPWKTKIMMARQAALGMVYLHNCKPRIMHRDLKSLNLLVDSNYSVKVADFGLSKVSNTGNTMNSRLGSLNWIAPEVLLHSAPYSDKADVYSFGMILWELVTHTPPFSGLHPLQIVRAIDHGELPPIEKDACPHPDYAQLIADCWMTDLEARPTFQQVLNRIQAIEKDLNAS